MWTLQLLIFSQLRLRMLLMHLFLIQQQQAFLKGSLDMILGSLMIEIRTIACFMLNNVQLYGVVLILGGAVFLTQPI